MSGDPLLGLVADSGSTASLLFPAATPAGLTLTDRSSLGDVTGDGVPDFAYPRAIQGSILEVFSGATGRQLSTLQTGPVTAADRIANLDGDGQEDLVLGTSGGFASPGRVRVLSTATWNFLVNITGDVPCGRLGSKVSVLDDLNGNGVPDILAAGMGSDGSGIVRVYSGLDGSLVRGFDGAVPGVPIGLRLDSVGDANGDGSGDFPVTYTVQASRIGLSLGGDDLGNTICLPTVPNSVGGFASLDAVGSSVATHNQVTLQVTSLPTGQPRMFLNALQIDSVVPGGSQGTPCLGGGIGSYNQPLQSSGANGSAFQILDLAAPPPHGPRAGPGGRDLVLPVLVPGRPGWRRRDLELLERQTASFPIAPPTGPAKKAKNW